MDKKLIFIINNKVNNNIINNKVNNKVNNNIINNKVNNNKIKVNKVVNKIVNKIKIFIFANCQGLAICNILNNKLNSNLYEINHLHNYHYIHLDHLDFNLKNNLINCDIFIYQPLSNRYPIYNSENLKTLLKSTCKIVSFPYIYCNAFTPVAKMFSQDFTINNEYISITNEKIKYNNDEVIINLKKEGKSLDEIFLLYDENKIDFLYEKRFNNTINMLKQKEDEYNEGGVIISDFLISNIKQKILFHIYNGLFFFNHISNEIVLELTNRILKKLNINLIDEYNGPEYPGGEFLVSKYDLDFFKFEFIKEPSINADEIYKKIIEEIYLLN